MTTYYIQSEEIFQSIVLKTIIFKANILNILKKGSYELRISMSKTSLEKNSRCPIFSWVRKVYFQKKKRKIYFPYKIFINKEKTDGMGTQYFCDPSAKNAKTESNHEETSVKLKPRNTLQKK